MEEKLVNSGYVRDRLLPARSKAMSLDRATLLSPEASTDKQKVVTFMINQNVGLRKEINAFFKSHGS